MRGWCRRSKQIDMFNQILPLSTIIEVACSLSPQQVSCLTDGPKYVPPCQSSFSKQPIERIIHREYQIIVEGFKNGLSKHCITASDQRAKAFFLAIESLLREKYTTPLQSKLSNRTQYENRIIQSTRRRLRKSNVVVRLTDKSKVLHLSSAEDYRRKALQYMQETNAYQEITTRINPCQEHVKKVLALIDPMLKNGLINLKLWKQKMRPNSDTTELAHLYFIPKPHKVNKYCFDR